jgi:hypothetical protein
VLLGHSKAEANTMVIGVKIHGQTFKVKHNPKRSALQPEVNDAHKTD